MEEKRENYARIRNGHGEDASTEAAANMAQQGYELADEEVKISFDEFLNKFTLPDGTAEYVFELDSTF